MLHAVINPSKPKMLASNNNGAIRVGMAIGFIVVAILTAAS